VANPNIVNVTTILGNTSTTLISSTANPFATALVNNAASSGKVYKINSIVAANVDGSSACDITISIFSQDLEDKSIGATASAANDIVVTISWEEISS
jgi:hypothetical protein